MDIFLINFKNIHIGKNKIEINAFQKANSRIFLKQILNSYYNIFDEILEENKKPYLKNSKLNFSISHSNNLFVYAFDKNTIGIDAELKRNLNYKKILKKYNLDENKYSLCDFFQLWTIFEAEYKSKIKQDVFSFDYENYTVSVSYKNETETNIYEIISFDNKLELKNLKNINPVFLPKIQARI